MKVKSNTIYTIGYQRMKIYDFRSVLKTHGIECLIDVRLHPFSQWVTDYNPPVLTEVISPVKYVHVVECAPSKALKQEIKNGLGWNEFERRYETEITTRWNKIDRILAPVLENNISCFLCFERKKLTPSGNVSKKLFYGHELQCHRRVLAEHVQAVCEEHGNRIKIIHLGQNHK